MATLTEWLKIMLAEIARKQEEAARATADQKKISPAQNGPSRPAG
jgi:hypothetical protein